MEDSLADMFNKLAISLENQDAILKAIRYRGTLLDPGTAQKYLGVLTLEDTDSLPDPQKTTGDVTIDKLLLVLRKAAKHKESGCRDLFNLIGAPIYNALCDLVESSVAYADLTDEVCQNARMHLAWDAGNPFRETTHQMAQKLLSPIQIFSRFETPAS